MPGEKLRQLLLRGPRPGDARWETAWQALLVLAAAGLVYWPFLGHSGFAFSEGQRVFPGWGMARGGDWMVPRLFGQAYLRKPPGMPWAVGLASLIFGETEFSARAVSAMAVTLGALTSFAFGTRWFGRPWGLAAGLAYALGLPFLFFCSPTSPVGRSAEIEALHNLFAQGSMLIVIELAVARPARPTAALWCAALSACLAGMAVVKGPSGLPCVGGAMLGVCVAQRSGRALLSGWLWLAVLGAGLITGYVFWLIHKRALELPEPPITQSAAQFLWPREQVLDVLLLPFATLASALPASLSLPLVWRRGADRFTRGLAWTCVAGLAIYTAAGVPNTRYAMPAVTILPILWAPVLRDHFARPADERPGWKRVLLNRPAIWGLALLVFGIGSIGYTETRRAERTSGRAAGVALGEVLEDHTQIWGDQLADQRPEVLYYARVRAAELGKDVQPRWVPARRGEGPPMPPPGGYIVLLENQPGEPGHTEVERYERAGLLTRMREVYRGNAHKFAFRVYQNPG